MRPDTGPDPGGNRPNAGQQRSIEYSKVPERQICDRTRPVADLPLWNLTVLDQTLLSYVRSVAASVRSSVRSPICRVLCPASGLASDHLSELVSS